jgi:hypothetical protein
MIETIANRPLRDVMYEMSLAKHIPDPELLDEFVRQYPQHAEALTEFAIELAIDALLDRDVDEDIPADLEAVSPVVSRVMSQFENRLYERRQARAATPPVRAATALAVNPFATLDRAEYRVLATRLDVNSVFLSKLRDRIIDPATIPKGFCRHVADEMDEDLPRLCDHLYAPQESPSHGRQFYKAEGKPAVTARQSFEEAVKSSGLTEDQQRRLLSFRD